jgi:hypothetical protein
MPTNFEERLARLEQKRIEEGAPPARDLPNYDNRGGGSGGNGDRAKPPKGGSGMLPTILFGIALLVGLPLAAYSVTAYLNQNPDLSEDVKQKADFTAGAVEAMAVAYGPAKNVEQREARRLVEGVRLRFNLGTMSDEEMEYWGSDEGQLRLAEKQGKAMNIGALKAIAKKMYGVD